MPYSSSSAASGGGGGFQHLRPSFEDGTLFDIDRLGGTIPHQFAGRLYFQLLTRGHIAGHVSLDHNIAGFDVGFDEPVDSTPVESIWAGRECTYGGE